MSQKSAIDYLAEIEQSENKDWFNCLCFYSKNFYSPQDVGTEQWKYICNLFYNQKTDKNHLPTVHKVDVRVLPRPTTPHHLEVIKNFNNFSKLSNSLELDFSHRVTTIFGSNGTGKSSLCRAIKILSGHIDKDKPLHNVFSRSQDNISFDYKFSNDKEIMRMDDIAKLEPISKEIKYFDSKISILNAKDVPDVRKVVEIAPFNLGIFDVLDELMDEFQVKLSEVLQARENDVNSKIIEIKERLWIDQDILSKKAFGQMEELSGVDSCRKFLEWYSNFSSENDVGDLSERLSQLKTNIILYKEKSSSNGLEMASRELQLASKVLVNLKMVSQKIKELDDINIENVLKKYQAKLATQSQLVEELLPDKNKIEEFKQFLTKSREIIDYKNNKNEECVFCKQKLSEQSKDVIVEYYKFLDSSLEAEIKELQTQIELFETKKGELLQLVKIESLPIFPKLLETIRASVEKKYGKLFELCEMTKELFVEMNDFRWGNILIEEYVLVGSLVKREAAEIQNHESFLEQAKKQYYQSLKEFEELSLLQEIRKIGGIGSLEMLLQEYDDHVGAFSSASLSSLKRRITAKAKVAYSELVVSGFRDTLEKHYLELTDKSISQSGFVVKTKAGRGDSKVDLDVSICGHPVSKVCSEGEQKVYSLALFFAEQSVEGHSILVFDDPVSSLDYTYVGNFCMRLKKLIVENPDVQVVVFTHDWYFLKDFQDQLSRSGLNDNKDFQVLVLENCNTVLKGYEKQGALIHEIQSAIKGEASIEISEVELIYGKLRRLTENIINEIVFNKQRTQYKRDQIHPSNFAHYVSLVPITKEEASLFSDLYSKFCPWLHDNPSSGFVKVDREILRKQFNDLMTLKDALEQRKKSSL